MYSSFNCQPVQRARFLPLTSTLFGLAKPMASNCKQESHPHSPSLQLYPCTDGISSFWKEKYERDARKYWDVFYKRHQDRFFKDRHYLDKEWGNYFSGEKIVVLEVGCGAGNTIYPLLTCFPNIFVHACDFSSRAISLVKMHKDYNDSFVHAFVCDLIVDDLVNEIPPSSVDVVTMIFVLSAVSPKNMSRVLHNVKKVLKPNGYVLLRDYATGDLSQERFNCKDQKISESFYVRGDGTRAYYFSEEVLEDLFKANGFDTEQIGLCCKQVENRSRKIVMNRRWIQGVFKLKPYSDPEFDVLQGIGAEMFGITTPDNQFIDLKIGDFEFKLEVLSKEHQHTCKSTGLMIWESANLMAFVLAFNPSVVEGKNVVELGCGCSGICSMISSRSAAHVAATDGDEVALQLLNRNISSNRKNLTADRLVTAQLNWGCSDHITDLRRTCPNGFHVVIGTDVTYRQEAIEPLFTTARELISPEGLVLLCHVLRQVDEASLVKTASRNGFRLVERWPSDQESGCGVVSSWISSIPVNDFLPTTALSIMLFVLN